MDFHFNSKLKERGLIDFKIKLLSSIILVIDLILTNFSKVITYETVLL